MKLHDSTIPKLDFDNARLVAKLDHVQKSYPGSTALKDVSVEILKGQLTIITGSSGSGKSTLIRILQGIERPDSGEAVILGHDFRRLPSKHIRKIIQSQVSVGFQASLLDRSFTIVDNIKLQAGATNRSIDDHELAEAAFNFGLEKVMNREASTLSGGQQIRASLLRSIATGNKVILLDEPTSALDSENKIAVFNSIHNAVRHMDASAAIVTHDSDLARTIADREITLHDGLVVGDVSLR